jgi:hypothetical protein
MKNQASVGSEMKPPSNLKIEEVIMCCLIRAITTSDGGYNGYETMVE